VKYADDLVLLPKEETVLLGMIARLLEIGRCYGIEMNVEKTEVMRIQGKHPQYRLQETKTTAESGIFELLG
jgi:hypothetical protein